MRRALLLCAVLALLAPNAALGHVILESSQPVTQSRLETPPNEIRLRFNQAVTVAPGAIQVLAPDGTLLSGAATTSEEGRVVAAPVSRIARGAGYTVRWRVIGADGHAPAGVFTFGVGVAAPPPTEAVGASAATWRDDVARWALFVALALLIGPLVVRLVVVRGPVPARVERGFHLLGVVAAFLVIDVGIVAFVLRASNALQLPLGDLLYGDLQPFAEKTRFGIAFLAMTLGFGIVAAVLLLAWILDRPELRWPALVLSLALASGLSLSGHQATEDNAAWLAQGADWLHLVAASVWAGGLMALAFLVWPLAPSLRRGAFLGFARLAVLLVGALVVAGAYLALARLPEVSDLWQTQYGRLLLLKLGIVALALTWGAAHHFLVRPRFEAGREPNVRPSLAGEAAVALTVLLAAAILTNAAPPPAEPPAANARSAR
ncbi:MAG TPA: copper resistance protein CopC [Gaiellaceae bacterium]|nr:copper resistance protein CopC [Gaiellaceae bacterium]